MRCAQSRPTGGPCRRVAAAAISSGDYLLTVMCPACTREALRLVPGVAVRWFDERRPIRGRAS